MFRRIGLFGKLSAIAAFALAVRVAFAWVYIHGHSARALGTIPFLFEPGNIAYSIATGNGFSSPFRVDTGPTAWMTPVYPLILAGIFRLFGAYTFHAYLAAAGLNILFSAATCIPLFFAARRIAGERAGFIAALLWAVFPTAILLPYESLWDASLSALLLAAIIWLTVSGIWRGYGLLWGLALMTNAALVSLLPFLLGWAGYRGRGKPMQAALVILLCCAPWTIRNYRVFHTLVPLRSVGGLALWLGTRPDFPHPISNQAEREKYVELGEVEYMREKQNEAVSYIVHHPGEEAALSGPRFAAFWTGATSFNKTSPRFYWVVLFNVAIAAGAVAGCVALWRRRSAYAFPLTAIPVVFPLIYYLALAPPRYRHPIDPALLLLSVIYYAQNDSKNPVRTALFRRGGPRGGTSGDSVVVGRSPRIGRQKRHPGKSGAHRQQ